MLNILAYNLELNFLFTIMFLLIVFLNLFHYVLELRDYREL